MHTAHTNRIRLRYGKWSVVTGASSGIGRAMAEELASAGLNLVLVARRQKELEQLADQLSAAHKIEARVVACDLSGMSGIDRVIAATENLDVGSLVAAAGFGTSGGFIEAELTDELSMLEVNCRATTVLTWHFGRKFVARGRGGLVLFGSLVGFQGTPCAAHYAATKAYVQTLAEGLHVELKSKGVDVLAAAPGPVHSGFADRARMVLGVADQPVTVARAVMRKLGRNMTVTPGALGKLLTWSLMTSPRRLRVRIIGTIMAGMTRRQEAS